MPAISVNMITKDQVGPTLRALGSLTNGLLRDCDEVVIVDTGSSAQNLAALDEGVAQLRESVGLALSTRVISRPELSVELQPLIEQWLPEFVGKIEEDEQYHDLRGILDFAAARQVALDASTRPIIFWIDSDDVFVEETPGRTRQVVDENMRAPDDCNYGALFLEYQYAFAEDGQLTTTLKRERFAWREQFEWRGKCHETLCPIPGIETPAVGFNQDLAAHIQHTEARKKYQISDIRNYVILRSEVETWGEPGVYKDPRTLFYLANACRGLARFKEAVELYKRFDGQSGSADDRFSAAMYIANIYMHPDIRRPVDALDYYDKCCEIKPSDPRGYFGKSRCYLALHRYVDCLNYFNIGRQFPDPTHSLHSFDPTQTQFQPYLIASEAAREMERVQDAVRFAEHAHKARPNHAEARHFLERTQQWAAGHDLSEAVIYVGQHVRGGPPNARRVCRQLLDELAVVPSQLEKTGIGKIEPTDPRPDAPKVAIWCGETIEAWGPETAKTGIGGSEKMVMLLAPELQKRGYNVTVYNNCPYPQRGVHPDGVRWQHWSEADYSQDLHALIAWRSQPHILQPFSAAKRILWLHDIQSPGRYNEEVIATCDAAVVQSEYHGEPLADVPVEVLRGRNAIRAPEDPPPAATRDPNKIVYLSCPTRGLTTAIRMFTEARKSNPALHMTVLYGLTPFFRKCHAANDHMHIPDLGRDASVTDYERYMGRLCDQYNVRLLNRVGFDQVWEELYSAGIWLYPTAFPEISCMAAMEAQAAGLVCVQSGFAALAETVLPEARELGTVLGEVKRTQGYIDAGARALVRAAAVPADDPRRDKQARAAVAAFNIEDLAQQWADWIGRPDGCPERTQSGAASDEWSPENEDTSPPRTSSKAADSKAKPSPALSATS